ncbi:SDR family oxidoreductase [Sphingomonas sp. R86520]|uniref:SDR family oxidoreductase n=1 Tax=Sphingomonas sp. R86520 TaxID=3093859 RepID=UPI0036D2EDAB
MQHWFITGVGSGLGRAMTEHLLKRGDRVFGTVRKLDTVSDISAQYGDRFEVAQLDLTDIDAIRPVVDAAFATGPIDVVVNNAGYGLFGAAEGLSHEQIRHQLDTNLVGPIEIARAALPHLREQGRGQIIAISSYGGQATHPGASLYHASKWGLEGFFDSLAQEVASFGIGVTIVEPGASRTGFRSNAFERIGADVDAYRDTPLGHLRTVLTDPARTPNGDPEAMAAAIVENADSGNKELRLVLGSDAQMILDRALSQRLESVRSQAASAAGTDFPTSA